MDLDKSLPLSEKGEEREREEQGVVRSLHWKPRIRCGVWTLLNIEYCLF